MCRSTDREVERCTDGWLPYLLNERPFDPYPHSWLHKRTCACVCVCVRMCVRACACTHCTSLAPYRAGGATQLTRTASVRGTPICSLPCLLRSSIMACNRPSSQRSGNAKRMSRPEDMHGIHIHICVLESTSAYVWGGRSVGCVCVCVRASVRVCVCVSCFCPSVSLSLSVYMHHTNQGQRRGQRWSDSPHTQARPLYPLRLASTCLSRCPSATGVARPLEAAQN